MQLRMRALNSTLRRGDFLGFMFILGIKYDSVRLSLVQEAFHFMEGLEVRFRLKLNHCNSTPRKLSGSWIIYLISIKYSRRR